METIIQIDNLKCNGCAGTIKTELSKLSAITLVEVDNEKEEVKIQYTDGRVVEQVKHRLKQLGYPEKGTTEGFEKVSTNLKSYVSCAIGKIRAENKTDKYHAKP